MAADGSVIIDIFGDDSQLRSMLGKLGSLTKKGMKAVTASIGGATAALGGFAAYAIKSGAEFETSMAKASTLFGQVDVDMDGLKAKVLDVSNRTGVAAADLGNSLYSALSAGIPVTEDMTEATEFLEKSARLAKAGFTDIDTALSATAKTINAYGMSVEDTDKIQKVMIQTQNLGITTVGELGASLAQVTPTAAAFGVSFEQVGAALANMTAQGTPTAQATTQLNALIAELGKAGTIGAKGLAEATAGTKYAGMGFKEMMNSGATLNELLDMMAAQADKSGLSMVDMFGSLEAGKAAMAVSGENSAKFASNLEAMGTSADVVGEAYDKMANTIQGRTEVLKTNLNNFAIVVSQKLQGSVVDAIGAVSGYVGELNTVMSAAFADAKTTEQIDAVTASLTDLGYSAEDASKLVNSGMGGVVSALGGIASKALNDIVQAAPAMLEAAATLVSSFLEGISDNAPALAQGALSIVASLAGSIITLLPQFVQTGTDMILNLAQGLTQSLPELVPKGVEMIGNLIQGVVGNLDQIISAGIDVLVAFGEGLINALPQLIKQVPRIVIGICDAINNNASKLLLSAAKLLVQLGIGLIKAIPTLIQNIPVIIEAIVKAFIAFNWLKLGSSLVKGIASGLKSAVGFVQNEAKNIVSVIQRHVSALPGKLLQVGKDIVKGLANGIKGGAKWAVDAIKNLGASMLGGIKDFFKIHSPSAVMRDEVGKNVVLGAAEGIVKNTRTVTRNAEEFSAQVLDAATSWVEGKKFYNQLAVKDELAFWEQIKASAKLSAKDLAEVDRKIYTAQTNTSKALLDDTAKWVEKKKFYGRLSAKEELEAWENLLTNESLLADEREQAERNLYTAKQSLAEKQQKLDKEYQKNLESRTEALKGFAGLFDQISEDGEITVEGLLDNLQGQVDAFAQWQRDMETLAGKSGMSDALMDELRELGPKSAGEIHALATASGGALDKFVKLFEEKSKLAKETAERELGEIAIPMKFTNDDATVAANLKTVTETAATTVEALAVGMEDTMFRISDVAMNIAEEFSQVIIKQKADYYTAGVMMIQGLWQGIASQRSGLINNIVQMLQAAVTAAKEAMDIHSPSRVWAGIGSNMAAGLGVGFVDQMRSVSAQVSRAMTMETAKLSTQMAITAERETSQSVIKTITNHNDNGVQQTVIIQQPVKSPAETARAIKRAGRELVRV